MSQHFKEIRTKRRFDAAAGFILQPGDNSWLKDD
jgi:hypothetical protein